MVARYFALRCAPAECVPASQGAAETYGCVTTEPGGGETTVAGALELEHFRFRLNRKCSRSLSESVIHASLAIPPEAITL
jgi:hypothetical protein